MVRRGGAAWAVGLVSDPRQLCDSEIGLVSDLLASVHREERRLERRLPGHSSQTLAYLPY